MKRSAFAVWTGGLKNGTGAISTDSGVLAKTPYGFQTRFEEAPGTNPEELIAAAHAGCFTMALAAQLEKESMTAVSLRTTAAVTLEKTNGNFLITTIHLELEAKIPGANQAALNRVANIAKLECPVSRLVNAKVTLTSTLLV